MPDDDWFGDDTPGQAAASRQKSPVALTVVPDDPATADHDWFTGAPAPITPAAAASEPSPSPRNRGGRNMSWAVVGITVLLLLGVAGVSAALLMSSDDNATTTATAPITTATSGSAATASSATDVAWCAKLGSGQPVTTTSTEPGWRAIAAFERAYYIERNAATARSFVSPDARVGSVEDLAAGINTVPPGTVHCVLAQNIGHGIHAVELFARRPDGTLDHYRQTITTVDAAQSPTGALITGVVARDGT
ncbi:hypothetical protein [Nocardia asiatica]|uniref:hypothetical protein n=1 Tax=Nocardia asiatica TaxID=209252 RepID=UPI00031792A3|nr:hypothetical protein [Nocardia asiatica]